MHKRFVMVPPCETDSLQRAPGVRGGGQKLQCICMGHLYQFLVQLRSTVVSEKLP